LKHHKPSAAVSNAIDVDVELSQAEQDLVERLRRLPAKKVEALPWSIRQSLGRLKRVRAKAEATKGWPLF
jgi:hypothetical protein